MTLFFMHLTKTAGGSLKELFKDAAAGGEDILFHYPDEPGFRRYFDYEKPPKVLFGHYVYGAHEKADAPANYNRLLREPIARSISHQHLKNIDTSQIGNNLCSFDFIEQYFKYFNHWEFPNFLTRNLSGASNQVKFGGVAYDTYAKARHNLRRNFSYIGIFERVQDSLGRLKKIIPIRPKNLPKVNSGKYSRDTTFEEMRMLRALNRFDELLYEEAVTIFDRS